MKYSIITLPFSLLLLMLIGCSSSSNEENSVDNAGAITTQRLVQSTREFTDGTTQVISTEYSELGNMQRQVVRMDGEVSLIMTFETRPNGQLIRRSEDTDQDGQENFSTLYVYENGIDLSRVYRVGSDMLIDQVDIFQFENDLPVSRVTLDVENVETIDLVDESTGIPVFRRDFTFENGRYVLENIDTDGDGAVDRQEVLSYNADGTLATAELNSVSDGAIASSSFVYESGACNPNFTNAVFAYFCVDEN